MLLKLKIIMKVCILGDGLTSLALANLLINKNIKVDLLTEKELVNQSRSRTIGITKKNIDFFESKILNIKKLLWKLNKIEIYTENLRNQKILNFEKKDSEIFSIFKNKKLYDALNKKIKKNKFFSRKFISNNDFSITDRYTLIFNCNKDHLITKKFFSKKIEKKYNSTAYTAIIKHKKIPNSTATQIFTKKGPIAFLPVSNDETSIVYSANINEPFELKNVINKYNLKYSIIKILEKKSFPLKALNLRSYQYKNILSFGDVIHQIHPLAGQGFNMSIRDLSELSGIIDNKIELGLELDASIFTEFEKKTKHNNFIFTFGVDLIHGFFDQERKLDLEFISKFIQYLGKNNSLKNIISKYADEGLSL